jgi:hypothetical protein
VARPEHETAAGAGAQTSRGGDQFAEVRSDAAEIDIGNEAHNVAVPTDRDRRPMRRFGCTKAELRVMAAWLKQQGIRTVSSSKLTLTCFASRIMPWTIGLAGIFKIAHPAGRCRYHTRSLSSDRV